MKPVLLFLGVLNNDDLDWMILKGIKETIAPGKVLIQEGKAIDAFYIVVSGSFSVRIESLENKELAELARLFSGEIVGEVSFIDARPPLATVRAETESLVLSIPRLQLNAKLQQDTGFAARFYHAIAICLSDRLRGTVSRLGYGMELEELEDQKDSFEQGITGNMDLARVKFEWLVNGVKGRKGS
ncbi:cyclic nucleotide-binding domain-containing protein [Tumidithrix elongata RA019]|uniref:Cyclic nucleotide-binding domain-containing protein n=1 Tax=Tumidithrix elongata BACA0141 TaxID=2716417 RepID=A0AAW9Q4Q1_9CYAN|nr:cyclic nucleotide-binding domain-containing protein [Tumidithrix elongata RA019]